MGEGTWTDGDHLWIAEAAIRHWLSGRTDETGTHLRAHVELPD